MINAQDLALLVVLAGWTWLSFVCGRVSNREEWKGMALIYFPVGIVTMLATGAVLFAAIGATK